MISDQERNHTYKIVRLDGTISLLNISNSGDIFAELQSQMEAAGNGNFFTENACEDAIRALQSDYECNEGSRFACFLDNQLIVGFYVDISFQDGDRVTMMVSRFDNNVWHAHAVVRMRDAMMWFPMRATKGRLQVAKAAGQKVLWLNFWIFCLVFASFSLQPIKSMSDFIPIYILVMLAISTGWFILHYTGATDHLIYGERLFKALGFREPSLVDLAPYSQRRLGSGPSRHVYNLRSALEAHGSIAKRPAKAATPQ